MVNLTTYNLGSMVEGDTWAGISSYHINQAAQTYGTNLVQVNMTLKGRAGMGAGYLYLSSATGDGTIDNAGNWTFTINHIHNFPLPKFLSSWSENLSFNLGLNLHDSVSFLLNDDVIDQPKLSKF